MMAKFHVILAIFFLITTLWNVPSLANDEKENRPKVKEENKIFEMATLAEQFVKVLNHVPSASEFWEQYVSKSVPVLIKKITRYSPAFTTWNRNFLKNTYGNLTVKLVDKRNRQKAPTGSEGLGFDSLLNFLTINYRRGTYVESQLPIPMQKDILIMPFLTCGPVTRSITTSNLIISLNTLHSQWQRNSPSMLQCLLRGVQDWALIESKYNEKLPSVCEIADFESSPVAYLDDDEIQGCLKSKAQVPWHYVRVNEGDCLYIPHGYSHMVSYKGKHNVGFSVILDRTEHHDLQYLQRQDCSKAKIKPLEKIDLPWNYPGYGHMSMGNINPVERRANFASRLELTGLPITEENLRSFFKAGSISNATIDKTLDSLRKHVDFNNKITKEQLLAIPIESWKDIQAILELDANPHNNIHYERVYFHQKLIREMIKAAFDKSSKELDQEKFSNAYKKIGGSEKYVQEIIAALDRNKDGKIDAIELKDNLNKAVESYNSEAQKHDESSYDVKGLLYDREGEEEHEEDEGDEFEQLRELIKNKELPEKLQHLDEEELLNYLRRYRDEL